jgi:Helix-turn-helix domain
MTRRNRRPDWRRIKTLRSYTIDEAATVLRVHRNAVRYWIKRCALPVFTDQRPHLIQGGDLVSFLKGRREAKRQSCGSGQFFCLKCRQPRIPAQGMVDYRPITASRGSLVGMCPICETLMHRFVSQPRLAAVLREFNVQIALRQESLKDTAKPRVDCHLSNENRA